MLQDARSAPKLEVAQTAKSTSGSMTGSPHRSRKKLLGRTLLVGATLSMVPFVLWACQSHPLQSPNPKAVGELTQYRELNPVHNADIVFMVDDSGSMSEEQAKLVKHFPLFMQQLNVPGADLHIAVVSSDMGAGTGSFSQSCATGGGDKGTFCMHRNDAGVMVDTCAQCAVNVADGRFLRTVNPNFPANSLANTFTCMATLGTSGCGFEHQLAALRASLTSPANGAFVRDDAYLAFVIITDEDDCSAPPDSTLFTADNPGQDSSLRCALAGHTCGGAHNDGTVDVDRPLDECQPADDGGLTPIQEFVDSIVALKKGDPNMIVASGIFGLPLPPPPNTPPTNYKINANGNRGMNTTRSLQPICKSPPVRGQEDNTATAGLRVQKFVKSFPNAATFSICQEDFAAALSAIGSKIGVLLGSPCVDAPLIDTKTGGELTLGPIAAGTHSDNGDCAVLERRPRSGGGEDEVLLPRCSAGGTGACWSLVSEPACAVSNYKIDIDRKGEEVIPGTKQSIRCLTRVAGK
jgi:hypothetical protein